MSSEEYLQCPFWPGCKDNKHIDGLYSNKGNLNVHLRKHHSILNCLKEITIKKVYKQQKGLVDSESSSSGEPSKNSITSPRRLRSSEKREKPTCSAPTNVWKKSRNLPSSGKFLESGSDSESSCTETITSSRRLRSSDKPLQWLQSTCVTPMSGQKERCNRRVISSSDGNDEIQVNERMALSEQASVTPTNVQKERCNRRVVSSSDENDEIQLNEQMELVKQGESEGESSQKVQFPARSLSDESQLNEQMDLVFQDDEPPRKIQKKDRSLSDENNENQLNERIELGEPEPMEPSVEFKEYRVFLNWLKTKQQERVAACKVILDCPANFTEQSDLVCVSKLQRRPYPPFQPGVFYEGLNESEAWSLVRTSNTETPAAENPETTVSEVEAKPKAKNLHGVIIEIDDSD